MTATAQETSTKKKAPKKKKDAIVAKDTNTEVVVFDYGDEYDQGYDAAASEDMLIPRLKVLQSNSPECLPVKDGGIEGASAGMLYNTVTQEVMESCLFVPACSEKVYNEWIDRDDGGGFVARHELADPFVVQKKKDTPRGKILFDAEDGKTHQLTETVYLYMIPLDKNGVPTGGFCVLDFTSTKLSAWRAWNTKIQTFTMPTKNGKKRPPFYAHSARVSTKGQKNDHGRWYNLVFEPAEKDLRSSLIPPNSAAFSTAKDLADLVKSGMARAAQAEVDDSFPPRDDVDESKGSF